MSYDITFDGSLVDNRDVPQVSAVSSLTKLNTVTFSPNWEFTTYPLFSPVNYTNISSIAWGSLSSPAIVSEGSITNSSIGQDNGVSWHSSTGPANSLMSYVVPIPVGAYSTINVDFSPPATGVASQLYLIRQRNSSGNTVATTEYASYVNLPISTPLSINPSTRFIQLEVTSASRLGARITYVRMYVNTTAGVTITPSTLVNGANKTGGVATTATVATVQDGSSAVSGPAKEFGVVVKDGTVTKAIAKMTPAADTSEEAEADITDVKIITADNTSLTVEAEGLGGPEKLTQGTSILVEDFTEQTEN